MKSLSISFRQIPHTTTLFLDYLYDFNRVARFYDYDPFDHGSFARAADKLRGGAPHRAELADILAEQNRRWGADAAAEENAARLRDARVVAVVTGQQPALFGGPAFGAYKAMSAVVLARKLTAGGLPAVPVFWLAAEDHDFAEVSYCSFLNADGGLEQFRDPQSPPPNRSVGEISFAASIAPLRSAVQDLWPRQAATETEQLLSGYAPGASYSDAFARLLHRLFAATGLVLLDPLDPGLKRLSASVFRNVLARADDLRAAVQRRGRELEKAGYHAQVRLRENATLCFCSVEGERCPLRQRSDGGFSAGSREFTRASLLEELEAAPEHFTPNVLLRPVIQDSLLPTVAYVAGPAEVAYFAEAQVLYQKLLGRMPVIVPRASVTLIERRVGRLLERYCLSPADTFASPASLRLRLSRKYFSRSLSRALDRTESGVGRLLKSLEKPLRALDPTLAGALDTSRRKMLYQVGKLRARTERAVAARHAILERHEKELGDSLWPARGLQERQSSFLSFWARHGRRLVAQLTEKLSVPGRDHQVFFLDR